MFNFFHNKLVYNIKLVIYILVLFSCVYNYIESPRIVCLLNSCKNPTFMIMVSMFSRAVAITCMISRFTAMYKNISAIPNYKKKIKDYEVYYPMSVVKENLRRFFIIFVTFLYFILIIPFNVYRLYLLYYYFKNIMINLFFVLMYLQNVSLAMTEIQFMLHCSGLYLKFQSINEDMSTMKSKMILLNRYPFVLKSEERKSIDLYPSARNIELLKIRHQFLCESVNNLNEIYSIQIGMSICVLFVMLLFDIYEAVTTKLAQTKTPLLFYVWLIQYIFRFVIVILTSYVTTKEVIVDLIKYNKLYKSYKITKICFKKLPNTYL